MKAGLQRLQLEFLGLGFVGSVLVTFPMILHPTTRVPGNELVGPYSHLWKIWWTCEALIHQGRNPAHSTMLAYPEGLDVGYYMANFLNGIWTLPITHVLGPVASYNAVCLITPAAGCWAAAVLGRAVGLPRWPAAFVGLTWAFAPHYLGFMMGGGIENLGTPWFPLFVLAALRLLGLSPDGELRSNRRCLAWSVLLALTLWLVAMTSWFNGLTLALFAAWFAVVGLCIRRLGAARGAAWFSLGLAAGCAAVVVSAKLLLPTPDVATPSFFHIQSDNLGFLAMGWKRQVPDDILYSATTLWLNHHLLIVVALLALLGTRIAGGRLWLLLSLPLLADFLVPDSWLAWTDRAIPASLASLYGVVARLFQEPQRRLFPLHLLLSLSAGFGLVWSARRLQEAGWTTVSRAVSVAAIVAWGAELALAGPIRLPMASFDVRQSSHVAYLAQQPSGAVIDVPIVVGPQMGAEMDIKAVHSRYLWYQTGHGHPILAAVGTQLPYSIHDLPVSDPLIALVVNRCCWPSAWTPAPLRWDPGNLRRLGYSWIVVHLDLLTTPASEQLVPELRQLLGEPLASAEEALVFRVPEGIRSVEPDLVEVPPLQARRSMDVTHVMESLRPHEYASGCNVNYLLRRLTDAGSIREAWDVSALADDRLAAASRGAPGREQLDRFSDSVITVVRQRRHLMQKQSHRVTGLMTAQSLYRVWQLIGERERAAQLEQALAQQMAWAGFQPRLGDLPLHPGGLRLPPCFWPVEVGPGGPGRPADEATTVGGQLECWEDADMTWLDETYEVVYWSEGSGGGDMKVKKKLPPR